MLVQRQAQGLAGNGLLDLQVGHGLRDGSRPDHLILDLVAQALLITGEGQPTPDIVEPGLGHYVRHAVAHPQVGTHRAVKDLLEDRKHISRCPADVYADDVDTLAPSHGLDDHAHCCRGRDDWRAGPGDELLVAWSLSHDVFKEQVVNFVTGRQQVLALEDWPDVVGDRQRRFVAQDLLDLGPCLFVAGVDDRQLVTNAQARFWVSSGDVLGNLDHVRDRAAVGAAGEQDHVRPEMTDTFDFLVARPAVIRRQHVHHDCAGAQSAALRALRGHRLDHAGDHHLQATAGATGGDVDVHAGGAVCRSEDALTVQDGAAGEFFDLLDRVEHAAGHVLKGGLDRGRRFATVGLAILVPQLLNEDRLGGGTATIGGENDAQVLRIHAEEVACLPVRQDCS